MKTLIRPSILIGLAILGSLDFGVSQPSLATQPPPSREQLEALVAGLQFQQGAIDLQDGLATLHVPEGFRFLNGADASTVLVKIWGNPPQTAPLGMLMPAEAGPLSEDVGALS